MKKILFAASESVPFIKTGGLADVVGSLPKCFDKKYFDVRVIIPKYLCMSKEYTDRLEYIDSFYMDIGNDNKYVGVFKTEYEGVTFYFVDNEFYFSGVLRSSYSFQKPCYRCSRSSGSSLISYIAMTGRRDLSPFFSRNVFTRVNSSATSSRL